MGENKITKTPRKCNIEGTKFLFVTEIIAWIELLCSIFMAISKWVQSSKLTYSFIGDTLETNIKVIDEMKNSLTITGFTYLISGIIVFILLMTIYYLGQNIINLIRFQNKIEGDKIELK